MSITRLQQARQMYAMGQRVAKTLDGSRPGYRGDDAARSSEGTSGGRASPGAGAGFGDGPERGGGAPAGNSPPGDVISNNPDDIREQVRLGNPVSKIGTVVYGEPDFTKVGPGSTQYNNYIDDLNLQGATYNPINIPSFIPGSTLINTVGNFIGGIGFNKNTKFFSDNSIGGKINPATGKPFGYGIDGYKDYMRQRSLGNVGAYGGTELSQNAINERSGGDGGIMDVYNNPNDTTDDTTDDTTTDDDLILRFLGADSTLDPAAAGLASTDELREMLLERARNLYT